MFFMIFKFVFIKSAIFKINLIDLSYIYLVICIYFLNKICDKMWLDTIFLNKI